MRSTFPVLASVLCCVAGLSARLPAQSIQIQSAREYPGEQVLQLTEPRPLAPLTPFSPGSVTLASGLFRDRQELGRAYLLRLKTENLLQNHLLEAGVRIDTPVDQLHQGWEAASCQLRGHFLGHWLSAAAHLASLGGDSLLSARTHEIVAGLDRCQRLNGNGWVGSIPEKYLDILADNRTPIWSPQYTVHKTMMGLLDAYRFTHDTEALEVLRRSGDWFFAWSERMISEGHGAAVYGGECAGMLELWADLYEVTGDARYLRLASRYAMPDLFKDLLEDRDTLGNNHANATVPWIQGAARLYEVTGDTRYRRIVENFWRLAVTERGMFATTGNNAGEFWIPSGQFGRFLGARTQEHCTVYNMIRVADYLLRWTGDSHYADYIERALYNGVLAQQNPYTGMVSYFLPTQPGARKNWGSETKDFWCCHGSLVQAQTLYQDLVYYRQKDGISVGQFIPSRASFGEAGSRVTISQTTDPSGARWNFSSPDDSTRFIVELDLKSEQSAPWTLRLRQPAWALGSGVVTIDGEKVDASVSKDGFLELTRSWKSSHVSVCFTKRLVREPLPGDPQRFALLDGPIVLAALSSQEPQLASDSAVIPQYEHQYVDGRDWQASHYLARTRQGSVQLVPLYEIADEAYTLYLSSQ